MAPKYTTFGQLSKKADIFSFGVLYLEIVAGKKNILKNHLMNNIFQVGSLFMSLALRHAHLGKKKLCLTSLDKYFLQYKDHFGMVGIRAAHVWHQTT